MTAHVWILMRFFEAVSSTFCKQIFCTSMPACACPIPVNGNVTSIFLMFTFFNSVSLCFVISIYYQLLVQHDLLVCITWVIHSFKIGRKCFKNYYKKSSWSGFLLILQQMYKNSLSPLDVNYCTTPPNPITHISLRSVAKTLIWSYLVCKLFVPLKSHETKAPEAASFDILIFENSHANHVCVCTADLHQY